MSVDRGQYGRMSMCALVLEDNPVGDADSQLHFESFPGADGIEETYAVNSYREMGGDRMPQPSHVAYRGGNWSPFSLRLIFRAGVREVQNKRTGGAAAAAQALTTQNGFGDAEFQQILIEMERKVRWCQALTFPLERGLGEFEERRFARRAQAAQSALRISESLMADTTEALGSLRRNDPPIVLIVFGSWWIQRGYCTNVSVRWTGPWHPDTCRPYGAEVNLTFQPLKAQYPTWQDILAQAGAVGYTTDVPLSGVVEEQQLRESLQKRNNAAARAGAG